MRFSVELHEHVVRFIRRGCSINEQKAFYEKLDELRADPIKSSEAPADQDIRPYVLRFFRFGTAIAIFELDALESRIRVLQCRRLLRPPGEPARPK